MALKLIPLTIVLLYIAVCVIIGFIMQKKAQSGEEDFWVAGRQIGYVLGALALYSCLHSGAAYVGHPGLVYARGVTYFEAFGAGVVGAGLMTLVIFARPFSNSRGFTVPDFFSSRYPVKAISILVPIIIAIVSALYIITQLQGGGLVANYLLGIDRRLGILLMGGVVLLYTALGGMWADIITDAVQSVIMLGAYIAFGMIAIQKFGGYSNIVAQTAAVAPNFTRVAQPAVELFGIFTAWLFINCVMPYGLVRLYTAVNEKVARRTVVLCHAIYSLFWLFCAPWIGAAAILTDKNLKVPDMAAFVAMDALASPLLAGAANAAILAAIMSTADGLFISLSSSISHDLYKKILNPAASEKTVVRLGWAVMVIVGGAVMLVAMRPLGLIALLATAVGGFCAASFFSPLTLGIWWKRANNFGGTCGILAGALLYAILFISKVLPPYTETFVSVVFSAVVVVVASLVTPPPEKKVVDWLVQLHR